MHAYPHPSAHRATLLLALLLTARPGAAQDGANLVVNPGFEDGGATPAGWTLSGSPGVRAGVDTEVVHTGRRAARIEGLDPAQQPPNTQAWRQDIRTLPPGALWLTAWVRAERVDDAWLHVLLRDAGGTVLENYTVATTRGTHDWREFGAALPRPAGVTNLQVIVGLRKSKGTLWVDDVRLGASPATAAAVGTCVMAPTGPLTAGSTVPARFTFTLGASGLAAGGQLALRWEAWRPAREYRLEKPFLVTSSVAGARFTVEQPPPSNTYPPIAQPFAAIATLRTPASLPPGTTVTVAAELACSRSDNVMASLQAMVRPTATSLLLPVGEAWTLALVGGEATALLAVAEARPVEGRPGRLTVAAVDAHGNPAAGFRGTVRFGGVEGSSLPASYTFTAADRGSHDFAVTWPAGAISRVTVTSGDLKASANPVWPRRPDEPGVWFGDLHSHCEISSDAVGDPDLGYDHARRFFGLDFAAFSDHSPRGERWQRAMAAANRANVDGRFATLVAYEWSDSKHGHRNAYFPGDQGPQEPLGLANNTTAWWQLLARDKVEALTPPHHPNTDALVRNARGELVWGPADWSVVNHTYQPVVEICQVRGSFEAPGPDRALRIWAKDCGASVQAALAKGHRLGFYGSTDTHSGRPGNGPARAAVFSPTLTRRQVWDALARRACYATTGQPILVQFTLNGQPMGSELTAPPNQPRRLAWRVVGTGQVRRVDLLRNNQVVRSGAGEGRDDIAAAYEWPQRLDGVEWWYLRVVQEDDEMAWSSPVWVEPRG